MSEDYYPVCFKCRCRYPGYFASASGFHAMRTPFRSEEDLAKLEAWLGEHERHDIRIVWGQDELPWDDEDEEPVVEFCEPREIFQFGEGSTQT